MAIILLVLMDFNGFKSSLYQMDVQSASKFEGVISLSSLAAISEKALAYVSYLPC